MNDLELIKAFAELEGVIISSQAWGGVVMQYVCDDARMTAYNPITDLALNCAARDKYEVGVGYLNNLNNDTSVYILGKTGYIAHEVYFESKEEIPRAVI